jgi:hypothetical protein
MGESAWFFAKTFAKWGSLAGALTVFCVGYVRFHPPPPPPGIALCGICVMGGLVIMLLGTPLGAIAGALVAGIVGAILDCVVPKRPRATQSHLWK